MGLALKVFAAYVVVFLLVFWWDSKRGRAKARGRAYYVVPTIALLVIVVLSMVKLFVVYKVIVLLIVFIAVTATYLFYRKR